MPKRESVKTSEPYWYRIYLTECPVCGCSSESRERIAGNRPNNSAERYDFREAYDYCNYG